MRTTIELSETQRAELLRLAASRGEKGFSAVVREALDFYLAHQGGRTEAIRAALGLEGSLTAAEADAMASDIAKQREHWR